MKLTRVERWILVNQYRVLEALYPDEAKSIAEDREALQSGYELHYRGLAEMVRPDDDTLSEDECREVLDILSMYRALTQSYQELKDKTGIEEWAISFPGFDGNEEPKLLGYCRWYCESDGGKFKELNRGDQFNSHAPYLEAYRRMLAEWNKSKDKNHLTQMDIIRITNAMKHADHKLGPEVH